MAPTASPIGVAQVFVVSVSVPVVVVLWCFACGFRVCDGVDGVADVDYDGV